MLLAGGVGVVVAQTGDEFDAFVRARMASLLRFGHVLTGDPEAAADLVQDALERCGVRWSRLLEGGDPEAYVRRAIANGAVSRWRRSRRETLVAALPDRAAPDPAGHDDGLWRLLATLPRRQRAVIVLRYYEDMSEERIAATLGCSVGTVKSQASRAIASLRAALGDEREATWTS